MALPTPPQPTINTWLPSIGWPLRSKARLKPSPSNISPSRRPSGPFLTALQAPATMAAGLATSTKLSVVILCGMVTKAPPMLRSAKMARRNWG